MALYRNLILASVAALSVSACVTVPGTDQTLLGAGGIKKKLSFSDMDGVASAMKRESFDVRLIRYADDRPGSNMIPLGTDDVIYEYNNDQLTQGVDERLPGLVQSHFNFGVRNDHFYTVEMSLKHFRNYIQTGTFLTTRFGSYVSEVEVEMLVRDMNSNVMFRETYSSEFVNKRSAVDGRHPNEKQDRKMMLQTMNEAIKRIAYRTVWDVRNWHNGKYPKHIQAMTPVDSADGVYQESY